MSVTSKQRGSSCHTLYLSLGIMSVVHVTGPKNYEMSTVHSFMGNLPELLMAMAKDERTLICIAEFQNDRYIQFRVSSTRTIVEVVSNQFLSNMNALSTEDEDCLRVLGYEEPSSSRRPNWRYEVQDPMNIVPIVNVANSAITGALHAMSSDPIKIETFEVPSSRPPRQVDSD